MIKILTITVLTLILTLTLVGLGFRLCARPGRILGQTNET